MTTLALPIGPTELIIILVIILVLFGGARLAGLGKSTGRAIREFKEETKGLTDEEKQAEDDAVDAEVVDEESTTKEPPAVSGPKDNGTDSSSSTSQSAQPSDARRDS